MLPPSLRLLALILCLTAAAAAPYAAEPQQKSADQPVTPERVDALIRQLGDNVFSKRESAVKELEAIGDPALEALRKVVKASPSAEVRRRAEQLVAAIEPKPVHLMSAYFGPGVPLAESQHPVHAFRIMAEVNSKGEGKGTLTLTLTPPNYDEYGDLVTGTEVDNKVRPQRNERPGMTLPCTVEFVKKGAIGRVNQGAVTWSVYHLKGPKIKSPLFVATTGPGLTGGRLLVLGKDERVDYVVDLTDVTPRPGQSQGLPIPCHPGCFPASTLVNVPGGVQPIERIRAGAWVLSIDADGKANAATVTDVFVTRNRLWIVRVEGAELTTTETQPLALVSGGVRPAGELRAGDRVWRWVNRQRQAARVIGVSPAHREVDVYNLVLGENKCFVAGAFVVRSKPPAALPNNAAAGGR